MMENNMTVNQIKLKSGFIFSYPAPIHCKPSRPVNHKTEIQFNKLLARLNKKYPVLFPYCQWSYYKVIQSYTQQNTHPQLIDLTTISDNDNLKRIYDEIKDLSIVVCFGEKAYYAARKVEQTFHTKLKIIKTKDMNNPLERHIKLSNQTSTKRVRTNYDVLIQYNDIEKQLIDK